MNAALVAEETIKVGASTVIEGPSPSRHFSVIFEDDGETGYLYGLDYERKENPICDALHIYNVGQIADRERPSVVKLIWSSDGLKGALLINNYFHAVFDFEAHHGFCRTGFPKPDKSWMEFSHEWDDNVLNFFS